MIDKKISEKQTKYKTGRYIGFEALHVKVSTYWFEVTPCVWVDYVLLRNCLALYSTTAEYFLRSSKDFSFPKRTVLIINNWA